MSQDMSCHLFIVNKATMFKQQLSRAILYIARLLHIDGCIPDKLYLQLLYRRIFNKKLNLNNPKTFNEKLQWLKLYDRRPEYTTMVDKYAVKEYVASIIGKEYIIPTLGVWEKPEDIDWDALPDKFVIKCTHDSGGLIICKNKATLDTGAALKKLHRCLKRDYYKAGREWPYKNIHKRIIAEALIETKPAVKDLPDYKWYCFNGEPKYCQVIQNRSSSETIDFYDSEWKHQDFIGLNPSAVNSSVETPRPVDLDTHIRIAKALSKGIPFARIDLYSVGNKTWFGEITFFPASGTTASFRPEEYNRILGDLIQLPEKNR